MNLENQYYNAKSLKDDQPREAIVQFQGVLELEEEKGEWGFKALKQMIKLLFHLVRTVMIIFISKKVRTVVSKKCRFFLKYY